MRVVGNAIRNLYGQISITSPSTGNSSLQLNSTTYNWNSTGLGAIDAGIVGGFTGATSSSAWWMNAYVDPTQTLRYKTSGLIALENVADTTGWHWNSAVAGTAGASFAFNTVATLSQFGNFTAGPTTGIAIQGNGTANAYAISAVGNSTSGQSFGMNVLAGTTSADIAFAVLNQAASLNYVRVFGDGGVVVANPAGGDKGIGTINATGLFINNAAVTAGTGAGTTIAGTANQIAASASTGAVTLSFAANGVIMPAPSSGVSLTVTGFNGTHSTKIADSATNSFNAGFLEIPQNSQSAAYTTVRSDSGKHIYHPSADTTARTWTIDSNANVPYPIGTAITFDNDTGAGVITLAITTDTLVWLPSGSTGSRTIAANGQGTALKVTATRWHLTGVGIT